MPPATVGPYTLLKVLGDGSSGRVLLARTDKGARVALKVFRAELAAYPAFRAVLRREIDAAARVHSPRVVPVLDADPDADRPWVATQYVPAPPLPEVLAEQGALTVPAARRLGLGLAEALAAMRAAGVVHGDLKPGDVLLGPDGPHVTDVGFARAAAATPLTRGGALVGTLGYLAPEQVLGGVAGPASDIFALGAVLLFAATWRRPFGEGDATAVLHRVLHRDPDLDGLSSDLATVVAACLNRDPARRPGPDQVRETLRVAASTEAGPPADPGVRAAGPRHQQARPSPGPSAPGPSVRGHSVTGHSVTGHSSGRHSATARPSPVPRRRGRSRARRILTATAMSASLVGLFAVATADTIGVPPPPSPAVWVALR